MPLPIAILAGGLGTRMRPQTLTVPKAMLEVAGEPFIGHQLRRVAVCGYSRVVILVAYLGEMIEAYVGDGSRFGVEVAYVYDGDEPLGTAGAVAKALPLLGDAFLLTFGDAYLRVDHADVERSFIERGTDGLMTIFRPAPGDERPNAAAAHGHVTAYEKKAALPGLEYVDYGLSVFRSHVFADLPAGAPADLTEVNQALIALGELAAYIVPDRPFEIGSPTGLEQTERFLSLHGYANE
jgi:NDP-sugar pyrophosphorylase family protein